MSPAEPPAGPGNLQQIPSWLRIVKTFSSPAEAFTDIARAPHFILCLTIEILTAAFAGWYAVHRIGAMNMLVKSLQAVHMAQSVPPAQLAHQAAMMSKLAPVQAAFGIALLWVVLAAIMLGAENFGLGQQANYKQMLGITAHGMLPLTLLGWLSALVLMTSAHPAELDPQNLVGSNLGFYLSQHAALWLRVLGGRIDLFSFWVIGLLALGLQKAGTRVKYSSAFMIVLFLWAVFVLAATGLAALRS